MRAQGRQLVSCRIERLAEASNVTVTEDRENPGEQRNLAAVDLAGLSREEADKRLRHREADRGHSLPLALSFPAKVESIAER